jgi:hypothetical protein
LGNVHYGFEVSLENDYVVGWKGGNKGFDNKLRRNVPQDEAAAEQKFYNLYNEFLTYKRERSIAYKTYDEYKKKLLTLYLIDTDSIVQEIKDKYNLTSSGW